MSAPNETLQQFTDAQLALEIERHHIAMVDCSFNGNHQQARWHKEKIKDLIAERSLSQATVMQHALEAVK